MFMIHERKYWTHVPRVLPFILLIATFCYAFAHGIVIGQHKIGFEPIIRVRQSVAVAISRTQQPPLHGYLAYQSVIDALNRNGFEFERQNNSDADYWAALFNDPARLDRALREAHEVRVDTSAPPQLIHINELGFADYIDLSFRLFGLHFSSLYYLYFLIVGLSCALFVAQFYRSPFLVFLLTLYLAGIGFLENYARSKGVQVATVANSRLFEALSLLPAMHLFLLVWVRAPAKRATVAIAVVQAALLAFIVSCRTPALWQVGMLAIVTAGTAVAQIWRRRSVRALIGPGAWNGIWAGGLALAAVVIYAIAIEQSADKRYATEPKRHIVWHEVLMGVVGASVDLQREYLGHTHGIAFLDEDAYYTVVRDLRARNDRSSPIVVILNGQIELDSSTDNNAYERLQREMVFKIIKEHPFVVMAGLFTKLSHQIEEFSSRGAMSGDNLEMAAIIATLGMLSWLVGGRTNLSAREVRSGIAASGVVLICSIVPVLIEPSWLSAGALLCFLAAPFAALAILLATIVQQAERYAARHRKYGLSESAAKRGKPC